MKDYNLKVENRENKIVIKDYEDERKIKNMYLLRNMFLKKLRQRRKDINSRFTYKNLNNMTSKNKQ